MLKMKTIKYLLLGLILTSCMHTSTLYYGVGKVSEPAIEYVDGWYQIAYQVQIGADADYYNVYYYDGDELLGTHRTYIDKGIDKSVIYTEVLEVSEPVTLRVVITSFIGDMYKHSDTKEFELIIK